MAKASGEKLSLGAVTKLIIEHSELDGRTVRKVLDSMQEVVQAGLKSGSNVVLPFGVFRRIDKPATKAKTKMSFGKEITVKAKPASKGIKFYMNKQMRNLLD